MPPVHFSRQQLRRTARVTLLAWVFGLLSAMANAGLIQPVASAGRQLGHDHAHVADESSSPENEGSTTGCLQFCVGESSALTQGKAAHSPCPDSSSQETTS